MIPHAKRLPQGFVQDVLSEGSRAGAQGVTVSVLRLAGMVKLFAQHGDVGGLHLETMCIAGDWEWRVFNKGFEIGRGAATSLGDAVLAAEEFAGGRPSEWRNIGAEVTDERKKVRRRKRGEFL
jgi:hypothetical protein